MSRFIYGLPLYVIPKFTHTVLIDFGKNTATGEQVISLLLTSTCAKRKAFSFKRPKVIDC